MRVFIIGLVMLLFNAEASALGISDVRQECSGNRTRSVAKITFNLQVGADAGTPGLVYVAVHDDLQTRAAFFSMDGGWEEYLGGTMPIFMVMREGLQDMTIEVPFGMRAAGFQGYSLYVGYGLYLPGMEQEVEKRRIGIAKVREKFPDRQVYDPGDDYVRRLLVEREMKDSERYVKVADITSISCRNETMD